MGRNVMPGLSGGADGDSVMGCLTWLAVALMALLCLYLLTAGLAFRVRAAVLRMENDRAERG